MRVPAEVSEQSAQSSRGATEAHIAVGKQRRLVSQQKFTLNSLQEAKRGRKTVLTGHYRAGAPSEHGKAGQSVAVCEFSKIHAHVPSCNSPTSTASSCGGKIVSMLRLSRPGANGTAAYRSRLWTFRTGDHPVCRVSRSDGACIVGLENRREDLPDPRTLAQICLQVTLTSVSFLFLLLRLSLCLLGKGQHESHTTVGTWD